MRLRILPQIDETLASVASLILAAVRIPDRTAIDAGDGGMRIHFRFCPGCEAIAMYVVAARLRDDNLVSRQSSHTNT